MLLLLLLLLLIKLLLTRTSMLRRRRISSRGGVRRRRVAVTSTQVHRWRAVCAWWGQGRGRDGEGGVELVDDGCRVPCWCFGGRRLLVVAVSLVVEVVRLLEMRRMWFRIARNGRDWGRGKVGAWLEVVELVVQIWLSGGYV